MQSIFETIVQLVSPYILTPYQIQLLAFDIDTDIIAIQEIADSGLYSLIIVYPNKKLMQYSNMALRLELYEVAENIKNYFQNV